jgi:hypothetical protein
MMAAAVQTSECVWLGRMHDVFMEIATARPTVIADSLPGQ